MTYDYVPNASYGSLAFGMKPSEVEGILGQPTSIKSPFEGVPIDDELEPFVGSLRVMEFARTRKDHAFPQVTFDNDVAVFFTLFDIRQPFVIAGADVFAADRDGALAQIARQEDTCYENGEYFYFPKAGLQIPYTKLRRKLPYISLVSMDYEMGRLDYNFLEPTTALTR